MVSEAQNPGTSRRGGLFDSLKVLTATLIAIDHTRLEYFSTELEEECVRFSSMPVWMFVALFCAGLTKIVSSRGIVGLLRPFGLWLLHRFSPPRAGHCLLNARVPKLARELQSEGFAMNEL